MRNIEYRDVVLEGSCISGEWTVTDSAFEWFPYGEWAGFTSFLDTWWIRMARGDDAARQALVDLLGDEDVVRAYLEAAPATRAAAFDAALGYLSIVEAAEELAVSPDRLAEAVAARRDHLLG